MHIGPCISEVYIHFLSHSISNFFKSLKTELSWSGWGSLFPRWISHCCISKSSTFQVLLLKGSVPIENCVIMVSGPKNPKINSKIQSNRNRLLKQLNNLMHYWADFILFESSELFLFKDIKVSLNLLYDCNGSQVSDCIGHPKIY